MLAARISHSVFKRSGNRFASRNSVNLKSSAEEAKMTNSKMLFLGVATAAIVAGAMADASAQTAPNCPTMRKINVGVSVAPPNVVHSSPYVAKALGFFAKRCIDANIVQFEG